MLARRHSRLRIVPAIAGLAILTGLLALPPSAVAVELPITMDGQGTPASEASASSGPLALRLSAASVAFGDVAPGATSAPFRLEVTNTGLVPLKLRVSGADLRDAATGARIDAGRVAVATEDGKAIALDAERPLDGLVVPPSGKTTLRFTIKVPGGEEQWIPAGEYQGTLRLLAQEA